MAFERSYLLCASNSIETQATSPSITESKVVDSLQMVMQGLPFSCLLGKSMFQCPKMITPKLFVLSLMVKMLLDVACQLVYSWLHSSKTDDIMDLLLLLRPSQLNCLFGVDRPTQILHDRRNILNLN